MTGVPEWLRVVYIAQLLLGTVGCWFFVARYSTTYSWWKNELGSHLVVMSSCVGLWYTYFLIAVIWTNLPGKTLVRTLLFLALTAAVLWRVVIFERVRKTDKK